MTTTNSRKVLLPFATLVAAGAVAIGSGATWTSTTDTDITVKAGNVLHMNDRGGATLALSKIKPGESVEGSLTIRNDGDIPVDLTLSQTVADLAAQAFGDDPDNTTVGQESWLQLEIFRGTSLTGTSVYEGNFDAVLDGTVLAEDISASTADDSADERTITFVVTLDADAPNSQQGKQAEAQFNFVTSETDTATGDSTWDQVAAFVPGI